MRDELKPRNRSPRNEPFLTRVHQYQGERALSVEAWPWPTEPMTRAQMRRVLEEWIAFFREPRDIEHLTLWCRVTDELLAPLTAQTQLKTLTLKWGPYADVDPIGSLTHLEQLELGGATAMIDLTPLTRLSRLTHLTIIDSRRTHDYSPLGLLSSLRYLCVGEGMNGARWDADSLDFLRGLRELRAFIWGPRVRGKDYSPLLHLTQAEYVMVRGERDQSPSMTDLEWALPGLQAARREVSARVIPLYHGEELVAEMKTDVTGRVVIESVDPPT